MSEQATDAKNIHDAQLNQVRRDGLSSLIHHYNQFGAMIRGASAEKLGLKNSDLYATPLPGSSNVKVQNGVGTPGLFVGGAALLGAVLLGAMLNHRLAFLQRETTRETPAVVQDKPAPAKPNKWLKYQLRVIPDEE